MSSDSDSFSVSQGIIQPYMYEPEGRRREENRRDEEEAAAQEMPAEHRRMNRNPRDW